MSKLSNKDLQFSTVSGLLFQRIASGELEDSMEELIATISKESETPAEKVREIIMEHQGLILSNANRYGMSKAQKKSIDSFDKILSDPSNKEMLDGIFAKIDSEHEKYSGPTIEEYAAGVFRIPLPESHDSFLLTPEEKAASLFKKCQRLVSPTWSALEDHKNTTTISLLVILEVQNEWEGEPGPLAEKKRQYWKEVEEKFMKI